jgi:hypothetical protein
VNLRSRRKAREHLHDVCLSCKPGACVRNPAGSPSVYRRCWRSVEFWRGHFHTAQGELDKRATTLEEQHRVAERRNREREKQWEAAQKTPTEEAAALAVQMAQLEEQKQKLQRELQKVEATLQKTKKAHNANTMAREAARVEQAASMAEALAVSGACVWSMYMCEECVFIHQPVQLDRAHPQRRPKSAAQSDRFSHCAFCAGGGSRAG